MRTKHKGPLFLCDEKGRKRAVLMSYRAYLELVEDMSDLREMEDPASETWEDLDAVIAEIENARRV